MGSTPKPANAMDKMRLLRLTYRGKPDLHDDSDYKAQFKRDNPALYYKWFMDDERQNVRNVGFAQPNSVIHEAILTDDAELLTFLMQLGNFARDKTTRNGRMLWAQGGHGIELLMNLCIRSGAAECLKFLMDWTAKPGIPFKFDEKKLYERARDLAISTDPDIEPRIECLLLLDSLKPGNRAANAKADGLYGTLLSRAWSPGAVMQLADLLPPDTDFMPFVLANCRIRMRQPEIIRVLLNKIDRKLWNSLVMYKGRLATPMSMAAEGLHVNVMTMLLRKGVQPFEHHMAEGLISAGCNPLFAVVNQELPGKPEIQLPGGREVEDETMRKQLLRQWKSRVKPHASLMRTAVAMLVDAAKVDFTSHPHPHPAREDELTEMLDIAAISYIHTLRNFLLRNLPWQLPAEQASKLLVPVSDPLRRTTVWEAQNPIEPGLPTRGLPPTVTWRKGLSSGRLLREMLAEYGVELQPEFIDIWHILASANVVDEAERWLQVGSDRHSEGMPTDTRTQKGKQTGSWSSLDCLYDLIVAADRLPQTNMPLPSEGEATDAEQDVVAPAPEQLSAHTTEQLSVVDAAEVADGEESTSEDDKE
ncbi:hypothetical protein N656DRAFT_77840 [Canariomyces notabilis]|uniref:Ankyrin repeat protein n=1 Tax=Canariomyces notabilis TaxID=2074819 RepID=A0AAN6TE92_9PEZI|nr:hypothetical protein N656DRAFT_77840 [Canariomyces arenarius]